MQGMSQIANAYYQRSDQMEKEKVQDYFRRLDTDRNGKVSRENVGKLFKNSGISNFDNIFRELDVKNEGYLNFDSVAVLYYMDEIRVMICNGCKAGLYGMYFSCKKCLGKGTKDSFDLCCDCYIKVATPDTNRAITRNNQAEAIEHEHPITDFLDYHSLVNLLRDPTAAEENGQTQRKREIEQLQQIAKAYLKAGPENVQAAARNFCKSMDIDKKGSVKLGKFLDLMKQEGYTKMIDPEQFSELSQDGKNLSYDDVMTVFYIIKSGRPTCNGCKKFIPGVFFSCIECKATTIRAFNLCKGCYEGKKHPHNHDGKYAQLIDNYTLLQLNIHGNEGSVVSGTSVTAHPYQSTRNTSTDIKSRPKKRGRTSIPNPSTAIIPAPPQRPDNTATIKAALELFLTSFNVIGAAAVALGCTIM